MLFSLDFIFVPYELYEQYVRKNAIFLVEVVLYCQYSNRITSDICKFYFNLIPIIPTGIG